MTLCVTLLTGCQNAGPATAATFNDYDYSTPYQTYRSIMRAEDRKDAAALDDARVPSHSWAKMSRAQRISAIQQSWRTGKQAKGLLLNIMTHGSYRNDDEAYGELIEEAREELPNLSPDALRRVFFQVPDERTGDIGIFELWFLRVDDKWKLYPHGMLGTAGRWAFDDSSPTRAFRTVCTMVYYRDTYGLYQLLADPPPVDPDTYARIVRQRHQALRDEAGEPVVMIHNLFYAPSPSLKNVHVRPDRDERADTVEVFIDFGPGTVLDPHAYETFRLTDKGWRWMPKAYYVWHVSEEAAALAAQRDATSTGSAAVATQPAVEETGRGEQ